MASVLSSRVKLWFAGAALALLASFVARYVTRAQVLNANSQTAQTRELLHQLRGLLPALNAAENAQRGYLITLDASYLAPYRGCLERLTEDRQNVARLVGGNPLALARLRRLGEIVDDKVAEMTRAIELCERNEWDAARQALAAGRDRELTAQASDVVDLMTADEEIRLNRQVQTQREAERFNQINFFGVSACTLLLLAALLGAVRADTLKRALAAKTIETQQRRLRRIVESNMIGICFSLANGQIVDANDALLQLLGYDRMDLHAGRVNRQHLTDMQSRPLVERAMNEARQTGKCDPCELELLRRDGSRLPVLMGTARIDEAGEHFVHFILDLSGRRAADEAQARLAAIVESSQDEIISKTLDGRIATWNAGAQRMFGYTAAEVVGLPASILAPPERCAEGAQLIARLCAGERVEQVETERITKDGRRFHIALTMSLIRNAGNRLIGVALVGRDITARKLAEREREELLAAEQAARAESERTGRIKDEFLATLSHELRTPLNAILGWAHLLASGTLNADDVAQGLDIIARSARSQAQLIDDLLDMSRIVSGKLRMDLQNVLLPSVIEAAIESVRPAAEAKQIRLTRTLDPDCEPVRGDLNRLQQIVWNLLSNAVKFTPSGGQVVVELRMAGAAAQIIVSDTGQGIGAEFLPHVFERFRQADSSTTRRHSGLGLGLAIVRHLAESHGGSVAVTSPGEDQGSTFTVSLPVAQVISRPDDAPPTAVTASQPAAQDLSGVTVLVVDDEAEARVLVKRVLEAQQATVVTASSAAEALSVIRLCMPTVLLSDIGMPDVDGYQLIDRVRSLPPGKGGDLPAAALTAFARNEDRRRVLASGFQLHLSKPIEPMELLAAVASLAGR